MSTVGIVLIVKAKCLNFLNNKLKFREKEDKWTVSLIEINIQLLVFRLVSFLSLQKTLKKLACRISIIQPEWSLSEVLKVCEKEKKEKNIWIWKTTEAKSLYGKNKLFSVQLHMEWDFSESSEF